MNQRTKGFGVRKGSNQFGNGGQGERVAGFGRGSRFAAQDTVAWKSLRAIMGWMELELGSKRKMDADNLRSEGADHRLALDDYGRTSAAGGRPSRRMDRRRKGQTHHAEG